MLAPSLCLARGAGHAALVMEICGPDGLKRVAIGADGQLAPLPDHEQAEHAPGFCPACHALPAMAAFDPPLLPAPHWVRVTQADPIPEPAAPRPPIRGPPLGAQAPPLS
ncbi:hypothetical protein G3576_24710 [Roseomonas stagni]|uniref:DUF2946 domain-containing protein n=1 Tax=Falsiroseomonas algicola TaxID=2716930 RepID=A0A6M1LS10_9PROT|nr:hypothetical protein [Falsiroseomonas algicola]